MLRHPFRPILALFLLLLLPLTGCSPDARDLKGEVRTYYADSPALRFTAQVGADYGDTVFLTSLRYSGQGGQGIIEVLIPDTIAGISVRFEEDGLRLLWDGTEIDTGPLPDTELTPISLLPALAQSWQSGIYDDSYLENYQGTDTVTITSTLSQGVTAQTKFDTATLLPLRSEVYSGNRMILWCDFGDVAVG